METVTAQFHHDHACLSHIPYLAKLQILGLKKADNSFTAWTLPSIEYLYIFCFYSNCCILRAIVNPSHQSPDNPHKAFVAVRSDGQILSGCNWCCLYRPNLHCVNLPILEVVAHLKTLPLHQLFPCVATTQDAPKNSKKCVGTERVTKDSSVVELVIVPHSERVICLLQS